MTMTREEIVKKVTNVLVEALIVDEEEVWPDAALGADLGAESIDFLDIVFRLEREFGIKIPRGELFPESIFEGNPEMVQDRKITDKGMAHLRDRLPWADLTKINQSRDFSSIANLFTAGMIFQYVHLKLQSK